MYDVHVCSVLKLHTLPFHQQHELHSDDDVIDGEKKISICCFASDSPK